MSIVVVCGEHSLLTVTRWALVGRYERLVRTGVVTIREAQKAAARAYFADAQRIRRLGL